MSGGRRLVETLQRIGFAESRDLQAEGFDWVFDNEQVTPFLDWFCDNVGPANHLSEQEIKEFNMLESSGEGILEGDQLDDALKNASLADEDEMSPEMLREDILQMEEELETARMRKEHLLQQRNKLSLHHTGLTHRLTKMGIVESATKKRYKKSLEQNQKDNTEMNTALERLSQSTKDLISMYHQPAAPPFSSSSNVSQDAPFLSQQPLGQYHHTEERFTQELTGFTKKQFFKGIAELVGHDEGSRYQILDISNPSSLVIKGEKQHVTDNDCKELSRLQAIYPASQRRRIKAQVEEARLLAACNFAGDKLQSLNHRGYPSNVTELSERLNEFQTKLQKTQRLGAKIAESDLCDLIQESAVLQATRVLYGDYNLKIQRQDYFTSKQDQLIEQLTSQQSRHKFLLMAYEVEAHRHRETHRLLTAAEQLLNRNYQAQQARMNMMSDPGLAPSEGVRNTIDSRDIFINRLHNIIVDDSDRTSQKRQLFLTYSSLQEGAGHLAERLATLQQLLSSTNSSQDSRLADLEQTLKRCEEMVYAGSATIDGQPVLTPPQLMNGIIRLDQKLHNLEPTIRDIIGDYNGKLKMLKGDPLLARQRHLFVYLFTDPPRLRRAVSELTQRLEARLIQ